MSSGSRPLTLRHVLTLAALAVAHPAAWAAEPAPPYQVQWPQGWHLSHLPTATLSSGKNLGGERIRAVRQQNGAPVAVLELTWYPRNDGGREVLEDEFGEMLQWTSKSFESAGLTVRASSPKPASLGGHQGLQAEITCSSPGVSMRIWIAMASSHDYSYTLNYTATGENFERNRAAFEKTRDSLALK